MDTRDERVLIYDGYNVAGVVSAADLAAAGIRPREFFRQVLASRLLPGQQADWQRYIPATGEWLSVESVYGGDVPKPPTEETLRFFPMVGREVSL